MRKAAVLGYLLARASDTVADESGLPVAVRLEMLDALQSSLRMNSLSKNDFKTGIWCDLREEEEALMRALPNLMQELAELPSNEGQLVKNVVEVILSGQRLDLQRFALANSTQRIALSDDSELRDYTWRVAGCVGEFWTKLGLLTLKEGFSSENESRLLAWGRRFGQGLQLVNILRDLPKDLQVGRCYLPLIDPNDEQALRACHRRWCDECAVLLDDGLLYAATMKTRRLRLAVELPARIALETLALFDEKLWSPPPQPIKISRRRVKWLALQSFLGMGTLKR